MNKEDNEFSNYKGMENFLENYCDAYAKYQLENFPEMYSSIQSLRKEGLEFFIEEQFELKSLGCPIKIAESFFRKITDETIKKAWRNINFCTYSEQSELLAIEEKTLFITSQCKYAPIGLEMANNLNFLIIANIFITLGMSKEYFTDYVYNASFTRKRITPYKLDSIWNIALKFPKGTICQYCCDPSTELNFLPKEANNGVLNGD